MKLFISKTSPFARKCRIVANERGLNARIEEQIFVPIEGAPELVRVNPLSQIPALIDDDGVFWTDSSLISAWLCTQGSGPQLLPEAGTAEYWRVRRLETAAMGLIEMLAKIVYENRRDETERSPFWLKRWQDNLMRGFAQAEAICPHTADFDMGTISIVCAATFCDFRLGHLDWRGVAPKIAALHTELEKRPSFIDTYPK